MLNIRRKREAQGTGKKKKNPYKHNVLVTLSHLLSPFPPPPEKKCITLNKKHSDKNDDDCNFFVPYKRYNKKSEEVIHMLLRFIRKISLINLVMEDTLTIDTFESLPLPESALSFF